MLLDASAAKLSGDPQKVCCPFECDLWYIWEFKRASSSSGLVWVLVCSHKQVCSYRSWGGAKYIFLTHRDDVAAHYKWASALGAERIMHTMETNEKQRTK